jgi:hypothetical protein
LCRDVLEEYTVKMKKFTEIVSKAMEKSLSLEENCFLNQFGERGPLQARFNYYSCSERPDLVLGLKSHADGSGYTIILQDDVEGLQILKDNQWFTVPTISDALLVLMGDQMEVYIHIYATSVSLPCVTDFAILISNYQKLQRDTPLSKIADRIRDISRVSRKKNLTKVVKVKGAENSIPTS